MDGVVKLRPVYKIVLELLESNHSRLPAPLAAYVTVPVPHLFFRVSTTKGLTGILTLI